MKLPCSGRQAELAENQRLPPAKKTAAVAAASALALLRQRQFVGQKTLIDGFPETKQDAETVLAKIGLQREELTLQPFQILQSWDVWEESGAKHKKMTL